jgi:serine/threonine protein kinase
MGTVWLAVDQELDCLVAMKRAKAVTDDGSDTTQIEVEGGFAGKVPHSNIIMVHGVVGTGEDQWLVMEYFQSRNLAEIIAKDKAVRVRRVIHFGLQIADGLAAVHSAEVVHGDIKPANILINDAGMVKISDFGISRKVWHKETLATTGPAIGTPPYMSPETLDGGVSTPASDVFALGATLFAAVEGVPPYGPEGMPLSTLRRAARNQMEPMAKAGPLAPLLAGMLATEPAERPTMASVRVMLRELRDNTVGAETGGPPLVDTDSGTRSDTDSGTRADSDSGNRADSGSGTEVEPGPGRPPTTGGGRLGSRLRALLFRSPARTSLVAAIAVLLVAGIIAGITLGRGPSQQNSGATNPPVAKPPALIVNQRTADPCGLTSAGPLAKYGDAEVDPHYENFSRCDVIVQSDNYTIDMQTSLQDADGPAPTQPGALTYQGSVGVEPATTSQGSCLVTLLLADSTVVVVNAQEDDNNTDPALCAMAQAASQYAVGVINHSGVPQRKQPFDPASLANTNACTLLTATDLTAVPGIDAGTESPGFGDWECDWTGSNQTNVDLRFDQSQPLDSSDGQEVPIGPRAAFVSLDTGGCEADLVDRTYSISGGGQISELVNIEVDGKQPQSQQCDMAKQLAADVEPRLPSSS